jgi:hypothetical protein
MTRATRVAVAACILLLAFFLFVVVIALAKYYGYGTNGVLDGVIVAAVLGFLVAMGVRIYGKNSHYAKAQARMWPAPDAQERRADQPDTAPATAPAPAATTTDHHRTTR